MDQATLSVGLARAGFILYPTSYPETGCLTVMKAMAMGAIPITSQYTMSVLPDLTSGFDMGPGEKLTPEIAAHNEHMVEWVAMWTESVVRAVHWAQENVLSAMHLRARMRGATRSRFTWERTAGQVLDLLKM